MLYTQTTTKLHLAQQQMCRHINTYDCDLVRLQITTKPLQMYMYINLDDTLWHSVVYWHVFWAYLFELIPGEPEIIMSATFTYKVYMYKLFRKKVFFHKYVIIQMKNTCVP